MLISLAEWAQGIGIQQDSARQLIHAGKLPEAFKIGRNWVIPDDTPRPEDRRVKSGKYRDWRKKSVGD